MNRPYGRFNITLNANSYHKALSSELRGGAPEQPSAGI
jgi:hypothetical protein